MRESHHFSFSNFKGPTYKFSSSCKMTNEWSSTNVLIWGKYNYVERLEIQAIIDSAWQK